MSTTEVVKSTPRVRWWRSWSRQRVILMLVLVVLPLLAVGTGLAIYAYPRVFPTKDRLRARYTYKGDVKFKAEDFAGAKAFYEKAVALTPAPADTVYKLALACFAGGDAADKKRGLALMQELAPEEGPGYIPAYLWLARFILAIPPSTPEANRAKLLTVEKYLKHVIELEPKMVGPTVDAELLLGEINVAFGRLPQAEAAWGAIADQRPEILLLLANICKSQGKTDVARGWANKSLEYHREETSKHPENALVRTRWAFAEAFFDRFEEAETIFKDGLAKSPGDSTLTKGVCDLYVGWYDVLKNVPGQAENRISILDRGVKVNPTYKPLLLRLQASIRRKGAEPDQARALLATIRDSGKATSFAYQVAAEDAWQHNILTEARAYWEQAVKLAPDDMEITNNLAWILAFGPEPNEARAIELINKAVERDPSRASFRDTRGLILVKLKRWKDAEADLNLAARSELDRPELHLALAEVYDNMNLRDSAELERGYAKDKNRKRPAK